MDAISSGRLVQDWQRLAARNTGAPHHIFANKLPPSSPVPLRGLDGIVLLEIKFAWRKDVEEPDIGAVDHQLL